MGSACFTRNLGAEVTSKWIAANKSEGRGDGSLSRVSTVHHKKSSINPLEAANCYIMSRFVLHS